MTQKAQPSTIRILFADSFLMNVVLLILLSWFVYFISEPGGANKLIYLGFSIIVSFGAILFLVMRFNRYKKILITGVTVKGKIESTWLIKGYYNISYTYNYSGKEYTGEGKSASTSWSNALKKGDEVLLIIDADNPGDALLRNLYFG